MIDLLRSSLAAEATPDRLAAQLRSADPGLSEEGARDLGALIAAFVGSIPDALAEAVALARDRRWGRAVAFGTGSVLHYLVDEEDLFPEAEFGALGLVDDAFLVHAYLAALRDAVPVEPDEPDGHAGYRPPSAYAVEVVAALLPDGVADALRRTAISVVATATAIFAPPSEVVDLDATGRHGPHSLRGRAAVAALDYRGRTTRVSSQTGSGLS